MPGPVLLVAARPLHRRRRLPRRGPLPLIPTAARHSGAGYSSSAP
ncbi:hypothetical protein ACFFX0_12715 [Citricoccus parietis]|uniref:Uncharacterized protein n=1 Tax=Citricoccus parietis TaxID=592307 RepID=A0ABV5G031_9MICC